MTAIRTAVTVVGIVLVSSMARAGTADLPDVALPTPRMEGGKPLMQALKDRKTDRALWWRDLINEGHVLTFRDTRGTLTAGPYQTATGGYAKFAAVWWGRAPSAWRDVYACQAWDVALCVVEWFGRQRPILVDGERQ